MIPPNFPSFFLFHAINYAIKDFMKVHFWCKVYYIYFIYNIYIIIYILYIK